jgi:hypothetical protein
LTGRSIAYPGNPVSLLKSITGTGIKPQRSGSLTEGGEEKVKTLARGITPHKVINTRMQVIAHDIR